MKKKSRKEEENESSAKQVKGQRKRRESACRKGNREEEIRKEIHKMNPALWGLVWNFGGDGSKKSWRRETNTTGPRGPWVPRALPQPVACSVPIIWAALKPPSPPAVRFPECPFTHPSHGTRTPVWPGLGVVSGEQGFQSS